MQSIENFIIFSNDENVLFFLWTLYKRQLKFFLKFKDFSINNPNTSISKIFLHAMNKNITFLKHYKKLDANFSNPEKCLTYYLQEFDKAIEEKIRAKHSVDIDSILGIYYRINPLLKSPEFYHKPVCMESDRIILTQYRTGSHNLRIQTGRLNSEWHELRL